MKFNNRLFKKHISALHDQHRFFDGIKVKYKKQMYQRISDRFYSEFGVIYSYEAVRMWEQNRSNGPAEEREVHFLERYLQLPENSLFIVEEDDESIENEDKERDDMKITDFQRTVAFDCYTRIIEAIGFDIEDRIDEVRREVEVRVAVLPEELAKKLLVLLDLIEDKASAIDDDIPGVEITADGVIDLKNEEGAMKMIGTVAKKLYDIETEAGKFFVENIKMYF